MIDFYRPACCDNNFHLITSRVFHIDIAIINAAIWSHKLEHDNLAIAAQAQCLFFIGNINIPEHLPKMTILGVAITLFVVYTKIYQHMFISI